MIHDDVKLMLDILGGWIDAEEAGIQYDYATTFCSNCPNRDDDDYRDPDYTRRVCCKESEDYMLAEHETLSMAQAAHKYLTEFYKRIAPE